MPEKTDAATAEKTELKKYQPLVYLTAFTAALAGLLFGLDVGVISGALAFIARAFSASTLEQEWVVSSLLWGAVAGTLISGVISRRYGRRTTLLLAAAVFALGSILSMLAQSAGILIGCRVFLGLAVGMASFTAPLYLSEIAPARIRGALISMYQLMITIGIVLAFLSDTFFASYFKFHGVTGGHWRIMLGILVVPATVMFIGVFFLPESPRWLFLKGRKQEAGRVLARVRADGEEIARETAEIAAELEQENAGWRMFRRNGNFRRAVFLGIGLQVVQQLTGINVVMYYAPRIFQAAGFADTAEQMWGTVLVGVVNVLATFIAIAFVDRWGRKPIMYTGFLVMGVSMCVVGLAMPPAAPLAAGEVPVRAFISIAALLTFIIGFAASAGPIIWVICSEIYPLAGRDFGITCSTATNWIVNGVVGLTFLSLLEGIGPRATFLLYGGLEAVFIIFFLLWVPETKDVSLEKISANLLAGKKLREIGRGRGT